jgi:CBS-domain-containing membrane protein
MIAASMMDVQVPRLRPGDTLGEALRVCASAASVEAPVVDERGTLCGVARAASILRAAFDGPGASAPVSTNGMDAFLLKEVREVMTLDFVTVSPETRAADLAAILIGPGACARSVFVVDDSARLLGVITPAAMLKRLCEYAERTKKTP